MSDDTAQSLIDALDELLERERAALIDGDLEQIGRLMTLKEELIGRLNALDRAGQTPLDDLRRKAERNQVLLDNALEGIRAVADRIADLRRVRQGSETYDRHGRKAKLHATRTRKLEKRA